MKLLLIFVAICAPLVDRNSGEDSPPPGQALYRALPEKERADFLIFSLGHGYPRKTATLHRDSAADFRFPEALGINDDLLRKFQSLAYPENFTSNLYVLIRSRYNLDGIQMRTLILRRTVCLANGNCIDINDVGGLCCPF